MPIYSFNRMNPEIDPTVFIAPSATIIGDTIIGENSSVWFNCVIRADGDRIRIGPETNIQDMSVLHSDPGSPICIGRQVSIAHRCIIHGCRIEDQCVIGMGAVIMNGAVIGKNSIVAAGSVVTENTVIPPSSLVTGIPGKVKRSVNEDEIRKISTIANAYTTHAGMYKRPDIVSELTAS